MPLSICTLTGVDNNTRLKDLLLLSEQYPFVEWGILYSPKLEGHDSRFPSIANIVQALFMLPDYVNLAVHFCGRGVTDLLNGESVAQEIAELMERRIGRIQLNFVNSDDRIDFDKMRDTMNRHENITFITQHNSKNEKVYFEFEEVENHAVLFDSSGGRGLIPDNWPIPLENTICGYSGGLGPDNLEDQLVQINQLVGNRPFWIDMEGKLRDGNGNFSLLAAEKCLEIVSENIRNKNYRKELSSRTCN